MNKKASAALTSVVSAGIIGSSVLLMYVSMDNMKNIGMNNLFIKLSDLHYGVIADDIPPEIKMSLSSSELYNTEKLSVSISVTDDSDIENTVLYLDGNETEIKYENDTYVCELDMNEYSIGKHSLEITSSDIYHNKNNITGTFNIIECEEPEPEVPDYLREANLEWLKFDEESGRWYYLVEEGDYLIKIMGRINVSVEIMDAYNDNIYDPNLIFTGNKIWVTPESEANSDKWEAGITFMDGHTRDEITVYETVPNDENKTE